MAFDGGLLRFLELRAGAGRALWGLKQCKFIVILKTHPKDTVNLMRVWMGRRGRPQSNCKFTVFLDGKKGWAIKQM